MPTPSSPHARLPRIAPAEAEGRNRLLGALNGLLIDDLRLRARIAEPRPGEPALLFGAADVELSFAAERVFGQPAQPIVRASSALPEILMEMSRLEPLIAALERGCGRALEPRGLSAGPVEGLNLTLEAIDPAGQVVHAARLGVSEASAQGFQAHAGGGLGPAARALARCRLTLRGPLVPHRELAELEAGDLVLIPNPRAGLRAAWLEVGGTIHRGGFDPQGLAFHVQQEDFDMLDAPPGEDPPPSDQAEAPDAPQAIDQRLTDLPVRLQVALPAVEVAVGALAALAPGAVLPLPIEGQDLKVELLTGGVRIATGRLVALGEAYGVLVDAVAEG